MSDRISPMQHRNMALCNARQSVAQLDRQHHYRTLKAAREANLIQDLEVTRKTAEDRAESLWRIENAIPLTATMDSWRPGMLPGDHTQRPYSAGSFRFHETETQE